MSRLYSKWFLLTLVVFTLIGSSLWARRSYVVPTPYGYGMTERHSGVVRPYIVPPTYAHDPYYYGTSYQAYYGYYDPYYYPYTYGYPTYYGNSGYPAYTGYTSPSYQNPYSSQAATPALVAVNRLNLRSSPGKDQNVIGTLFYGEQVWVLSRSGNWFYIQSARRPSVFGYAYSSCFSGVPQRTNYYYSSYPSYW